MKKAIVYGAGDFGWNLLTKDENNHPFSILYCVDKSEDKIGTKINNYEIKSPDVITLFEFDYIIIAIEKWEGVAQWLIDELKIDSNNIFIYDLFAKQKLFSYREMIERERKLKFKHIDDLNSIFRELMDEAYKNGEFNGCDSIVVIGNKEQFNQICDWFSIVNPEIEVLHNQRDCIKYGKYIFTDSDYKERLACLHPDNWCVIPIYDIEESMLLHGGIRLQ